ncbi:MAG: HAMP domain-containing histidine kinase [Anaerolineae bacterium]|nr:HAMP domain-containing histidine kinase [Anaerolineae bacterium]
MIKIFLRDPSRSSWRFVVRWDFRLFVLGSFLFALFPRFIQLERLLIDVDYLVYPLTLFCYLPMLIGGYRLGEKASIAISLITGLLQSIFITNNVHTFLYWLTIGIVWGLLNPRYVEDSSSQRKLSLASAGQRVISFWLYSVIFSFLFLFLSIPGPIFNQLGKMFHLGWHIVGYQTILILLSASIVWLAMLYAPGRAEKQSSNHHGKLGSLLRVSKKQLFWQFGVPAFFGFLFFIATLIWHETERQVLKILKDNSTHVAESLLEDYQLFIESGGSYIRKYAQFIGDEGSTEVEAMNDSIRNLMVLAPPFYRLDLVIDGVVKPTSGGSQGESLADAVLHIADQIKGTSLPYRREVFITEEGPLYLFLSPVKNTEIVIAGYASIQHQSCFATGNPNFLHLPGEFILLDELGGGIYPPGRFQTRNEIVSLIQESQLAVQNPERNGIHWAFTISREVGDVTLMTRHVVPESDIFSLVFQSSKRALLSLIPLMAMCVVVGWVVVTRSQKSGKLVATWVTSLEGDEYQDPPVFYDPDQDLIIQTVSRTVQSVHNRLRKYELQTQMLRDLGAQLDVSSLFRFVLNSQVFSEVDSIRYSLSPEFCEIFPDRPAPQGGKGRMAAAYASMDSLLFKGMVKGDYRIIDDVRKAHVPSPGKTTPGCLAVHALRYQGVYYGVLWIANDQPGTIEVPLQQFFMLLSEEVSRILSSFFLFRRMEIEKFRLESVIQAMPEPVLVFDSALNLVMENSSAGKIRIDITNGKGITEHFIDEKIIPYLREMIGNHQNAMEITLSSGNVFSIVASSIHSSPDTTQDWLVCTLHDVTAYEKKDEMRTEFLETVGQYIQMPLKLSSGYIAMLSTVGDLNQAQKEYINAVSNNLAEMDHFINGVLDINRISAGLGIQVKDCNAIEIIEDVINRITPDARQRRIQIQFDPQTPGGSAKFEADPTLFSQALFNVVDNAVKFNRYGGEVSINLEFAPNGLSFTISDTGIGIAPIDIPHIFDGLDVRKRTTGGNTSRIGLALSKSIVNRHRGTIQVESVLGKGSSFKIWVPRIQDEEKFL